MSYLKLSKQSLIQESKLKDGMNNFDFKGFHRDIQIQTKEIYSTQKKKRPQTVNHQGRNKKWGDDDTIE